MFKKVINFFSSDNSKKIYDEIWAYFNFQSEINKYLTKELIFKKIMENKKFIL